MSHEPEQRNADSREELGAGAPRPGEILIEIDRRRVVRTLRFVIVGLLLVGLATQLYVELVDDPPFERLADRFDVDEEITVPTWYSSSALLFCSLLLAVIARGVGQQGGAHPRSWAGLAVIFLLASMDEASGFHELPMRVLRRSYDLPSFLYFAWVIPGAMVLVVFFLAYLRFWLHLPPRTRRLFALAAAVYVIGAFGFEMLGAHITATEGQGNTPFQLVATTEEALEMFGVLIFIGALLDHLAQLGGSVRIALDPRS